MSCRVNSGTTPSSYSKVHLPRYPPYLGIHGWSVFDAEMLMLTCWAAPKRAATNNLEVPRFCFFLFCKRCYIIHNTWHNTCKYIYIQYIYKHTIQRHTHTWFCIYEGNIEYLYDRDHRYMMFQKTRFNQILRPILEPNSQRWVFRNTEVLMSGRYLSPEDEGLEPENGKKTGDSNSVKWIMLWIYPLPCDSGKWRFKLEFLPE